MAVLALGAIASAGASAKLPEFGGCEPLPGGKYEDAGCTVPLKGKEQATKGHYEWFTGARFGYVNRLKLGFSETNGLEEEPLILNFGPTTFESSGGAKITCSEGTGEVQLHDANTSAFTRGHFVFYKCKSEGAPCVTAPYLTLNNTDEWYYEEGFTGELGYVEGKGSADPVVGFSLTPPKNTKGETVPLLVANCEGKVGTIDIGGDKKGGNTVIAVVTPIDEMVGSEEPASGFTLTYSESGGIQAPSAFEHKHGEFQGLVESEWERLGWSGAALTEFEHPIEIKAVK